MKNIFKYLLFLVCSATVLTSCFPDPEEEAMAYGGPTVVEFKNQTLGMVNAALQGRGIMTFTGFGQTDSSRFISSRRFVSGTTVTAARTVDSVLVQLVGPHRSTPTEVSFEVMTKSTAVAGTDYTFDASNANNKVTIPANSSQGYILIRPISSPGTPTRQIGLQLVGNENVQVSPNYDTFYVSIYQP